jgi:hypothetical protein
LQGAFHGISLGANTNLPLLVDLFGRLSKYRRHCQGTPASIARQLPAAAIRDTD